LLQHRCCRLHKQQQQQQGLQGLRRSQVAEPFGAACPEFAFAYEFALQLSPMSLLLHGFVLDTSTFHFPRADTPCATTDRLAQVFCPGSCAGRRAPPQAGGALHDVVRRQATTLRAAICSRARARTQRAPPQRDHNRRLSIRHSGCILDLNWSHNIPLLSRSVQLASVQTTQSVFLQLLCFERV
jgi:hypothetical protein